MDQQLSATLLNTNVGKKHIAETVICTVYGYVRTETNLLIPYLDFAIIDLILLLYAKPVIMGLEFDDNIRYILVCPVNDKWESIVSKIRSKFSLNPTLLIYLQSEHGDIDDENWHTSKLNETSIYEVKYSHYDVASFGDELFKDLAGFLRVLPSKSKQSIWERDMDQIKDKNLINKLLCDCIILYIQVNNYIHYPYVKHM